MAAILPRPQYVEEHEKAMKPDQDKSTFQQYVSILFHTIR